ncbi:MAG: TonB-dependent receptor [Gammaproteobacteria bacterium]|nr:TonB-dependent receptor [Gammaproteobacteria bacterium]MDH5305026.1 TonB-dependent receptor [Gammaproteobacteria bacterium]
MNWRTYCLVIAGFAAVSAAKAQAQDEITEVIYVVTSRLQSTPRNQVYDILTIPESDLGLYSGLAAALSEVPDLYVQSPGGRSGFASVFLSGADPNFTAVLLDGVPLNDPTNSRGGAVNVAEIESETFSRVDIADGALSSLYGSGALAGAINLIVPAGSPSPAARGVLGIGDQQDYLAFARLSGPLSANYGSSLALSLADDGEGEGGASFKAQSATVKLAPLQSTDSGSVLLRVSHTEANAFPDASGGDQFAVYRELEHRDSKQSLIGASYPLIFASGLRLDLRASALHSNSETDSPGVAPSALDPFGIPAGSDDSTYTRLLAQALATKNLAAWQVLLGLEHQGESGDSEGELIFFGTPIPNRFELDRATTSAFAEASRSKENWLLNLSARFDEVEDLGTHVTGRAGVRYQVPDSNLSLRAAISTGFKAPSLYALGNPFVGNPDLEPETSRAWRAGVEWTASADSVLTVSVFQTRYTDLIDFEPGPPPRLENRARVISEGVSARYAFALGASVSGSVYLQYADTRDRPSDNLLNDRPSWRAGAMLRWLPSPTVTITGRHAYIGERNGVSIPTGAVTLAEFHTLGLDVAWRLRPETVLRLSMDNVLDSEFEHAVGFTSPGRWIRMTISRDF